MAEAALMVGISADSLVAVPTPDDMTWGLQDVSSSDAGRTGDANATMHKNLVTRKRKIALAWKQPDAVVASRVLQAFYPEYVWVRYLDPLTNEYEIREFYSGDKSAPYHLIQVGGALYKSVSFDIIER